MTEPADPLACIYVRVPGSLKRMVERRAREAGLSVNAYAIKCLEGSLMPAGHEVESTKPGEQVEPSTKLDGIKAWLLNQISYLESIKRSEFGDGTLAAYRRTLEELEFANG